MADDPTVQFSLRRTSECPTCGHTTQPGDIECSLCGTTLPRDLSPPTPPSNPVSPPEIVPLSAEPSDSTVIAPLPPRASYTKEKTVKAPSPSSPSPTPRAAPFPEATSEEPTVKAPPPARPPLAPRPTPVQEEAGTAAPPVSGPPPPLRPIPVSPIPGPLPGLRTGQPTSVSLPPIQSQSSLLGKWGVLAVGALALFLVSFFAAKMFAPSEAEKEPTPPIPEARVERPEEKIAGSDEVERKDDPTTTSLPVTSPPITPPPQPVGRVTTAEQLLPIRVFGAESNDEMRGTAAFRTQVEQGIAAIREAYIAIAGNPQSLGAVVLEFIVASDGQVVSAVAHATGSVSRDLQQIIVNIAKSWRFLPSQGAEVKCFYPLLLSPEKIDAATFASHLNEVWPGRYKVLAGAPVPIRSQASDSAEQVGTFGPGLFLTVVSSQDGWLGALSPKGKVGYVRQDAIVPRVETATGSDAKG